jgi:hypothetical protein
MIRLLVLAVLTLWLCPPSFSSDLYEDALMARCRRELGERTAVLVHCVKYFYPSEESQFLVVAARDRRLEGMVLECTHVILKNDVWTNVYCRHGQDTPVLQLPSETFALPLDEELALQKYYASKRAPRVAYLPKRGPITAVTLRKSNSKTGH